MAEVLTGDGVRAIELPVRGGILVCSFLARLWTTSSSEVHLVAVDDPVLVLVFVSKVIVPLIQLAAIACLRRRFAADADQTPVDIPVNVDVAIAVGRCVIVGLDANKRS